MVCEIAGCIGTDEAGQQTLELLSAESGQGSSYAGISFGDPDGEGFHQRLVMSREGGGWEEPPDEPKRGSGCWALGLREFGAPPKVVQPRVAAVNGVNVAYAHGSIVRFRTESLGWCTREAGLRALGDQGHQLADGTVGILQFLLAQTDPQHSVIRRIDQVLTMVDGGYLIAFVCEQYLVVARYLFGERPVLVSRRGASSFFGSNESALRDRGELWREVSPGFMLILRADGFSHTRPLPRPIEVSVPHCPFSIKVDLSRLR